MPGLIVFKRRWAVGSDDLIVPGIFLLVVHSCWLLVLLIVLGMVEERDWLPPCMTDLYEHTVGYIIILGGCIAVEYFIAAVSLRGTILDDRPREPMQYLLYVRLGLFLVEMVWLFIGVLWIRSHYDLCPGNFAKEAIMGITITNWLVFLVAFLTGWCTFDSAGRSWVVMQKYNLSLSNQNPKYKYRRSGNSHRNWRHRRAVREYQNSWNRRCRILFCCMGHSERHQNSFADIAKLLSEFFRDLDVVPSDIVAGVILVRKMQKLQRQVTMNKTDNAIYQYLSGAQVTPSTKFLDMTDPKVVSDIESLVHYLHYAMAVYGWPIYVMTKNVTGCCQLCPYLKCSQCVTRNQLFQTCTQCCRTTSPVNGFSRRKSETPSSILFGDNCCRCNIATLDKLCESHDFEVIHVSYRVAIAEPSFFVVVDHEKKSVVVCVRGTLSLQDVITDLNAEGDLLPTNPRRDDWFGHKGMIEAALYINKQLVDRDLLHQAFYHSVDRGTNMYDLVLVGHSLGAGTATILSIMLRDKYPSLHCFAYAPPGGLLSLPAVEYSESFITSVVLGKDVVPRLGLHQMESLRFDLVNAIKHCNDPKWKVISEHLRCCCHSVSRQQSVAERNRSDKIGHSDIMDFVARKREKELSAHPQDDNIALTVHQPLYPPGKIVHIVRNHAPSDSNERAKHDAVYQALWADSKHFDEILISPVMIQDHMPDKILFALEKLLVHLGPPKPRRKCIRNVGDGLSVPLLQASPAFVPYTLSRSPSPESLIETLSDLRPEDLVDHYGIPLIQLPPRKTGFLSKAKPHKFAVNLRKKRNMYSLGDSWNRGRRAPLATPETLSETSSISASIANGHVNVGGFLKMETIAQSPQTVNSNLSHDNRSPAGRLSELNVLGTYSQASTRRIEDEAGNVQSTTPSAVDPQSEFSLQDLIDAFSTGRISPMLRGSSASTQRQQMTLESRCSISTNRSVDYSSNELLLSCSRSNESPITLHSLSSPGPSRTRTAANDNRALQLRPETRLLSFSSSLSSSASNHHHQQQGPHQVPDQWTDTLSPSMYRMPRTLNGAEQFTIDLEDINGQPD